MNAPLPCIGEACVRVKCLFDIVVVEWNLSVLISRLALFSFPFLFSFLLIISDYLDFHSYITVPLVAN